MKYAPASFKGILMNLYLVNLLCLNKDLVSKAIQTHPDIGYLLTFQDRKELEKVIELGIKKVMFDCGAYSAFTKGITINMDDLILYYSEIEKEYPDVEFSFIALDVIGDKRKGWDSYDNWQYMKQRINCIPTFHYGDNFDVLEAYASQTNYIAIGGLVTAKLTNREMYKFLNGIFNKYPNHKFHLFGINSFNVTQRYNVYSCDSLSWRSGSRFGTLITPFGSFNVSSRSSKCISKEEAKSNGVMEILKRYDVEFPFPEDFNYYYLDLINIFILYDEIVNKKFSRPTNIYEIGLF